MHDLLTIIFVVGYPDVKLDITGVTDKGKTPIDSALSFVKYHLVPDDETKPLVKGKIEEGSMSYTPQHPGLHYLYLYDDSGCSLYDRGLSVYG